ncbi:MAG: glycosyltransferase family 2 protein [Rhodospirillaceae bacterium]|nr:glycosyltransferase family 2 protein [Rhodospirillaceae bacterium]
MVAQPEQIDVVVRIHAVDRMAELNRCVFSLVSQTYRPLRIIVVTQRFSAEALAATKAALSPLLTGEEGVALDIINWAEAEPADARSVLLNLGVQNAQGRYLAYLDYDDALYPDAYELLIGKLRETGAAIAFASVRIMRLHVHGHFFYTAERLASFKGNTLIDLFRSNFCPIHSYVIDRSQVAPEALTFNANLLMEEDYDVLLRICARYPSDFSLIGTDVGDYYYKTDGSNTVPTDGVLSPQSVERFKGVRTTIEHRKRVTMVSDAVLKLLGLPPSIRLMSVRDVVDRYS